MEGDESDSGSFAGVERGVELLVMVTDVMRVGSRWGMDGTGSECLQRRFGLATPEKTSPHAARCLLWATD